MVVVEAGAVGTPVIATRVGALPELFADEILFVDFADPADLAGGAVLAGGADRVPAVESLREAIAAVGPAWGARLAARVARLCDPAVVAARYAALLDEVCAARRRAVAV
jgi:glycosyltransferase involved in cell wall biosynthesis